MPIESRDEDVGLIRTVTDLASLVIHFPRSVDQESRDDPSSTTDLAIGGHHIELQPTLGFCPPLLPTGAENRRPFLAD